MCVYYHGVATTYSRIACSVNSY